jgi:Ca2+-binding RTX toxin-like protein
MATWVAPNDNGWYNPGSQQYQYGLNGDDELAPSADNKSYILNGGSGNDELYGQSYNDDLYGGNNADYLVGDYGNDNLFGGLGQDTFVFDTTLNKNNNVDYLCDFQSGSGGDLIQLSKSIFKGVGDKNTTLKSNKFEEGKNATSSKTKILYNEDKGTLYFTKKGDEGNKVLFATLQPGVKLDSDDFYIIA